MKGGLLLDVVVLMGTAIFELLASEDETLLIGWDALLVLNLGLDGIDGVGALDLQGDGLARECLHEDLHSSTKAKDKMKGGLLLDVVVLRGTAIFELLAGEDETLLIGWDALLVLNLGLDGIDGVGALDLQGDGLAGECLHEDLHSSTKAKDK